MSTLKLLAYAKVNLYLAVLNRRPDGYHEIVSIIQNISLFDELSFEESTRLEIVSSLPIKPKDNLVTKAVKELSAVSKRENIKINLKKNIPVAAGLGGGSADAAATLIGLNDFWSLGLSKKELIDIGARIGSDVPFFIVGGTAEIKGTGEKVRKVANKTRPVFVIAKPAYGIQASEAYQRFDRKPVKNIPPLDSLTDALEKGDLAKMAANCSNMLEPGIADWHIHTNVIKKKALASGALNAVLSGSGPSVYCVAEDHSQAEQIASALRPHADQVYISEKRDFSVEKI